MVFRIVVFAKYTILNYKLTRFLCYLYLVLSVYFSCKKQTRMYEEDVNKLGYINSFKDNV